MNEPVKSNDDRGMLVYQDHHYEFIKNSTVVSDDATEDVFKETIALHKASLLNWARTSPDKTPTDYNEAKMYWKKIMECCHYTSSIPGNRLYDAKFEKDLRNILPNWGTPHARTEKVKDETANTQDECKQCSMSKDHSVLTDKGEWKPVSDGVILAGKKLTSIFLTQKDLDEIVKFNIEARQECGDIKQEHKDITYAMKSISDNRWVFIKLMD